MSLSRTHKRLLIIVTATVVVLLVLAQVFLYYLPIYLETRLLPRLSAEAGLDPHEMRIRRIGWRGADLGPMRLGLEGNTLLDVAAVQIDYSPVSLLRGRIDTIALRGVRIALTLNEQGTGIIGLEQRPSSPTDHDPQQPAPDLEEMLPVTIGRLILSQGWITVHWNAHSISAPFEMDLRTAHAGSGRREKDPAGSGDKATPPDIHSRIDAITGTANIGPAGNALRVTGAMDPRTRELALTLDGKGLDLSAFEGFRRNAPLTGGAVGHIDINALVQLRTAPFELTSLTLEAVTLSDVPGHLPDPSANPSLALTPPAMQLNLAARSRPDSETIEFEVEVEGAADRQENRLRIQSGEISGVSRPPRLSITGTYDADQGLRARFEGRLADLHVASPLATVQLPEWTVTGTLAAGQGVRIDATARIPVVRMAQESVTARLSGTQVDLRLGTDGVSPWVLTGDLTLPDGELGDSAHGVKVQGLSARLPFQWPLQEKAPPGEFKAGPIQWKSDLLGEVNGRLGLQTDGVWASGTHASKLFPGLNVLFNARVANGVTTVAVSVPEFAPAAEINLGRFSPGAAGFRFMGRLAAQADLVAKGGTMDSSARIKIDQGVARHPESGFTLEGIVCDLHLVDLMDLRSAPAQQLRIASMQLGKINASELRVDFQLEPSNTLFIEYAALQWAQGILQTQAFRLKPDLDDVAVTVFGDRLNLAMVLNQLGAAQGSGAGAVNGRIPVRWRDGKLSFDNGFLYSTPGQTGTIVLHGTDFLLDGLPAGSPQRTQLDIATEALKDYSYEWAKLTLNTRNADLLLGLQLDGKPNRLLPFAYDPQSGGFVRYKGEGQADFKGIRIDLNFTTPLNEILDYRGLLTPKGR